MPISITHENIGKKGMTTINWHLYINHAYQFFFFFWKKKMRKRERERDKERINSYKQYLEEKNLRN
jgi:hypothetical protein